MSLEFENVHYSNLIQSTKFFFFLNCPIPSQKGFFCLSIKTSIILILSFTFLNVLNDFMLLIRIYNNLLFSILHLIAVINLLLHLKNGNKLKYPYFAYNFYMFGLIIKLSFILFYALAINIFLTLYIISFTIKFYFLWIIFSYMKLQLSIKVIEHPQERAFKTNELIVNSISEGITIGIPVGQITAEVPNQTIDNHNEEPINDS